MRDSEECAGFYLLTTLKNVVHNNLVDIITCSIMSVSLLPYFNSYFCFHDSDFAAKGKRFCISEVLCTVENALRGAKSGS